MRGSSGQYPRECGAIKGDKMKIADFDFRIVKPKNKQGGYNSCGNDECVCNTPFLYGDEAKYRLGEFIDNGEGGIELWSGMTDKNGRRIYENDIVLIQRNTTTKYFPLYLDSNKKNTKRHIKRLTSQPFIIILSELKPFVFDAYDTATQGLVYPLEQIRDFIFEVIGNIHENAELLKGAKNEAK